MGALVHAFGNLYREQYPIFTKEKIQIIDKVITDEETKFSLTLGKGMREFSKFAREGEITGRNAFVLFSTYGFPLELTLELTLEQGLTVDVDGFKREMKEHQDISRKGAEQKFKGGLADHSEISVKYHTATHLLHQALRDVLGTHVFQKGSNITAERLRFDFSHPQKMTDEEKIKVENLVNQKIKEALPVSYEDIPIKEAEKLGALGLFEEKYGDKVRVYKIGPSNSSHSSPSDTRPSESRTGQAFSLEYCGGPHVENTKTLGHFKIKKEEAVSAGVRRIKAILE